MSHTGERRYARCSCRTTDSAQAARPGAGIIHETTTADCWQIVDPPRNWLGITMMIGSKDTRPITKLDDTHTGAQVRQD